MVFGLGGRLPVDHVASSAMTYQQPIDTVWEHVRSLGDYPRWWSNASSMERLPDVEGREAWQMRQPGDPGFPMEILESDQPVRLVTRILDDGLPFGGTWTYVLVGDSGRVRVTITENGKIYSPVFRVVAKLFLGYHGTQESYLTALAEHFGEEPMVERMQ